MSKKTKKIIVNSLTVSRIIGALTLPIIFATMSVPALITLLAVLFATDFLDGKLSRKWKVQTVGGSLLDPLGDKLLAISCLISLINTHSFMLVPLFLELAITAVNVYRSTKNDKVKVAMAGKFKTWLLSITLVLGAINLFNPDLVNQMLGLIGISTDALTITQDVLAAGAAATTASQMATLSIYTKDAANNNKDDRSLKIQELKNLKDILIRLFDEEKYEEDKDKSLKELIKK